MKLHGLEDNELNGKIGTLRSLVASTGKFAIEMDGEDTLCTNIPADVFPRVCFLFFFEHAWNGFIFFCGFCNVFLGPCIVLVSEMLSFTMVTKCKHLLV